MFFRIKRWGCFVLIALAQICACIVPFYEFRLGRVLGSGMSGDIVKVTDMVTQNKYALKSISKKQFVRTVTMRQRVDNEISIHKSMVHPNIVKLMHTIEDNEHVHIFTEICEGGDIFDFVGNTKDGLPEESVKKFTYQIAQAVRYLHEHDVIHNDLKPENIFLDKNHEVVKIGDFGLAVYRDASSAYTSKRAGSLPYMSPESLREDTLSPAKDIWALGVIIYTMLHRDQPFIGKSANDLVISINAGNFCLRGFTGSDEMRDLITRMLDINVGTRFSIHEVLSHPWFQSVNLTNLTT